MVPFVTDKDFSDVTTGSPDTGRRRRERERGREKQRPTHRQRQTGNTERETETHRDREALDQVMAQKSFAWYFVILLLLFVRVSLPTQKTSVYGSLIRGSVCTCI